MPARRALVRWAWRLCRGEWRQQGLVVVLLTIAVSATVLAAAIADNAPSSGRAATFGTATDVLTVAGDNPQLAADVAAVRRRYGPADVIEDQAITVPGSVTTIDLRAQDPHGPYGRPMLSLVSGRYPTGAGEVAVTDGAAALLDLHVGDSWIGAGPARRVVGVVENPANLLDQFALVAPGQVTTPTQVTVLFDAPPRRRLCTQESCAGAPIFPGGARAEVWAAGNNGASATSVVLVVALVGILFIGLIALVAFTVMAERRLRALGMIAAVGATGRQVGLVMVATGVIVGGVGTALGVGAGLAAWSIYRPHLQLQVERRLAWSHLPWAVIGAAAAAALLAVMAAAWRPARTVASVPVVTALSGRSQDRRRRWWWPVVGLVVSGAGLGCLAGAGGWQAVGTRHAVTAPSVLNSAGGTAAGLTGWTTGARTDLLFAGIVLSAVGVLTLAPLAVAAPASLARWAPAAVRLALRDLARHRQRSGAVLSAVAFVVLVPAVVAILITAQTADPFTPSGPNLAANQLIVYAPHGQIAAGPTGSGPAPTPAQQGTLQRTVDALAAAIHARFAVPLYSAGRLDPGANTPEAGTNQRAQLWQTANPVQQFPEPLYVATPALIEDFGVDPATVDPGTDLLTSVAGLSGVPDLALAGQGNVFTRHTLSGQGVPGSFRLSCPPASCIAGPTIQTVSQLPTGTAAPATIITEHAVHALGQQLVLDGWLVQTDGALTPGQQDAARQAALSLGARTEVGSGAPDPSSLRTTVGETGFLLALVILALTVGLVRTETGGESRLLTAVGAGSLTRRAHAAVTAGVLGLLGALIGAAAAYGLVLAWAHADASATLGAVPVDTLVQLLVFLPLTGAAGGWLLGGRAPRTTARGPWQ